MAVGKVRKILHLVPDAIFKNYKDEVEEWLDPRSRPTQAEIDAVTDQEVIDGEIDIEAERSLGISKRDKLLFELNYLQENRIRALEGFGDVTKAQYKTAIKNLYKTL